MKTTKVKSLKMCLLLFSRLVLPEGGGNLSSFQREYLSRCVDDAMEEHCHEIRMFLYKVSLIIGLFLKFLNNNN